MNSEFSLDSPPDIEKFLSKLAVHLVQPGAPFVSGETVDTLATRSLTIHNTDNDLLLFMDDLLDDNKDMTRTKDRQLMRQPFSCNRCTARCTLEGIISTTMGLSGVCLLHPGIKQSNTQTWSCCGKSTGPANQCVNSSHDLRMIAHTNKLEAASNRLNYIYLKHTYQLIPSKNMPDKLVGNYTLSIPLLYWLLIATCGSSVCVSLPHDASTYHKLASKVEKILYVKNPAEYFAKETHSILHGSNDAVNSHYENIVNIANKPFIVKASRITASRIIEYIEPVLDDDVTEDDSWEYDTIGNWGILSPVACPADDMDVSDHPKLAPVFMFKGRVIDTRRLIVVLKHTDDK